uniref:allene oxide synthase-lipoxygenase protein-like n=1 Tax=Styela clava TaxID=7725 RepID=UPI00193A5DB1|nr:allene oxide synthase-lipoxygenase protein-like [Styela clava]
MNYSQNKRPRMGPQSARYQIIVTTSKAYVGAEGTTNTVSVVLTGESGRRTEEKILREDGDLSFRRGETDVFEINAMDVGLPIIVKLRLLEHTGKDPWAVRTIVVKYKNEEVTFPVYDWIEDEISVTCGEALLTHKIRNKDVLEMRKLEVEKAQAKIQWSSPPGPEDLGRRMPRFMNANTVEEMPLTFRPTESWISSFAENDIENGAKKAMGLAQSQQLKLDSLESYHELYASFEDGKERSSHLDRWQSDEEFGRQQLNGITPISIERCTKLPEVCKITDDDVRELIGGYSLQEEMKDGKVYIGDYSEIFHGEIRNKDVAGNLLYCPDAICLYHVNSEDNLVPIAIQLVPNDRETIFTPKSSPEDWMLAKMYMKVAMGNLHEWSYHFLMTHNVMEPFSISLFRSFPRSHPMYKLLHPHLQVVTVINTIGRPNLMAKESASNKSIAIEGENIIRQIYKNFHFDDLVIPEVIKKKGLDDKKLLPKFHYRDDAVELWEIVEDFVGDVIKHYYTSDNDIQLDEDLQWFIKDVAEKGWAWFDGNKRGIPVPLTSIQELIRICTCVIYTSSVQHAAINFPQYETYKYVPNSPFAMRLPPHKQGEATMQRILDSLPNLFISCLSISVASGLSQYHDEIVLLGNYPIKLFTEKEVLKSIEKFKKKLDKHDERIRKRNDKLEFPYVHLLTGKIPNSIVI